jgi:hypothetical protein
MQQSPPAEGIDQVNVEKPPTGDKQHMQQQHGS